MTRQTTLALTRMALEFYLAVVRVAKNLRDITEWDSDGNQRENGRSA